MLDRSISLTQDIDERSGHRHPGGWLRTRVNGIVASWRAVFRRSRYEWAVVAVLAAFVAMIEVNTLYFQPVKHPAPLMTGTIASGKDGGKAVRRREPPGDVSTGVASPLIIQNIQIELARRDLYDQPAHGILDEATIGAIRRYQQMTGLGVDGRADRALLVHLLDAARNDSTASRRPYETPHVPARAEQLITRVQEALAARGYSPGAIDGIMGERTARAIRAFEAASGMPPSGRVDGALLRKLAIAVPGSG